MHAPHETMNSLVHCFGGVVGTRINSLVHCFGGVGARQAYKTMNSRVHCPDARPTWNNHGLVGFFLAQIIACKQVIVRYRIVRFVCSRYRWISYRSVRLCNLSLDIVSLVSRVQDYRRLLSRSYTSPCWGLWKSCRAVSLIREISANVVRRSTNGANLEEAQLWGISHKGRFSLGCPEAPEASFILTGLGGKVCTFYVFGARRLLKPL